MIAASVAHQRVRNLSMVWIGYWDEGTGVFTLPFGALFKMIVFLCKMYTIKKSHFTNSIITLR
jgi:hypothetical protein